MLAVKNAFRRLAHVLIASVFLHCGHVVMSDRALDAITDVGLDKAADLVIHHVVKE